jgi:hypothetical protein
LSGSFLYYVYRLLERNEDRYQRSCAGAGAATTTSCTTVVLANTYLHEELPMLPVDNSLRKSRCPRVVKQSEQQAVALMTDDSEETVNSQLATGGLCRGRGLRRCLVSGMALLTERCREVGGCEQTLPGKSSETLALACGATEMRQDTI